MGTDYPRSLLTLATVLFALTLFAGVEAAVAIPAWSLDQMLRAVLVFFYAWGSFYYYQAFLTRFAIRPQLAWTLFAFIVGAAAIAAANGIAGGRWFFECSTALFLAGLATFAYSWFELRRGRYTLAGVGTAGQIEATALTAAEMRKNVVCFAILAAAILAIQWAADLLAGFGISQTLAAFSICSTIYPTMLAITEFKFLPKIDAIAAADGGA